MISTRDLIILACVAIASLGWALSIGSTSSTPKVDGVVGLYDDSNISFELINQISLTRDGELFIFEKENGAWMQSVPFAMSMDPASMQAIIHAAQSMNVLSQVKEANLTSLDLGNHNLISFSDGTNSIEVQLGRKTLGGRAYASIGGKSPVVIDHGLHRIALDMDHKLWRDIRVFPHFAIDGTQIERDIEGDRLLLLREGGKWHMREPVATRVDQAILTEWVGTIAASRVGSFIADYPSDLSLFGLQFPSASFEVKNSQDQSWKLLIGSRISAGSQDRYVMLKGQPIVFAMKWAALEQLFPLAEVLIESTGSGASKFDVKRVTIRTKEKEVQFEKELERWMQLTGSTPTPATSDDVDALLNWVLEAKPLSVAIGVYPRSLEIATVTVDGYDLMPIDTVRIAQNDDGQYILENGDNVLRLHAEESGDVLQSFIK